MYSSQFKGNVSIEVLCRFFNLETQLFVEGKDGNQSNFRKKKIVIHLLEIKGA